MYIGSKLKNKNDFLQDCLRPREDLDQPAHPHILSKTFAVRMKKAGCLATFAQAYLSHCLADIRSCMKYCTSFK